LQKSQFKCFICLDYLQDEVKNNVNALITSLIKKVKIEDESINNNIENVNKDGLNDIEEVTHDIVTTENLLEHTKRLFLKL